MAEGWEEEEAVVEGLASAWVVEEDRPALVRLEAA